MRDHRSEARPASPWVQRFIIGAPADGTMLDVACGSGRNLRLARQRGLPVVGVDRDISAVGDLREENGVELIEADLETGNPVPFVGRKFGAVVVTNYLWRPILPEIVDAVASNGLLIYETFAAGHEQLGRPSNPAFLLRPGELIDAIAGRLTPLAYEQVRLEDPARIVQRICAAGADHPWCREGAPVSAPTSDIGNANA